MAARAAIALCLVALGWAGAARAQDDAHARSIMRPWRTICVLLSMAPRPTASGSFTADLNPATPRKAEFGTGMRMARRPRASPARTARSASMAACIWSFKSAERRLRIASTAPEPAEDSAGAALFPRAVGDQREGRASHQAPGRGNAGNVIPDEGSLLATEPLSNWEAGGSPDDTLLQDLAGSVCDGRHIPITRTLKHCNLRRIGSFGHGRSPHLCRARAVVTAAKALDVRAEVRHRRQGSSAVEDGRKFAFSTSMLQNA